jgi:hypothetical protein
MTDPVQDIIAPAAIERALGIYQQMHDCEHTVLMQARKTLTEKVYALINGGESDETRLVVGALSHLKALDRARAADAPGAVGKH